MIRRRLDAGLLPVSPGVSRYLLDVDPGETFSALA
jgi:hypothetical protein